MKKNLSNLVQELLTLGETYLSKAYPKEYILIKDASNHF